MYTADNHTLVFHHEEPGRDPQGLATCQCHSDAKRLADLLNAAADLDLNARHAEQHPIYSKDRAHAIGMRVDRVRSAFLDLHAWVVRAVTVGVVLALLAVPALAADINEPYVPKRLDEVTKSVDEVSTRPESRGYVTLRGSPQSPSDGDVRRVEASMERIRQEQ